MFVPAFNRGQSIPQQRHSVVGCCNGSSVTAIGDRVSKDGAGHLIDDVEF